jgi:hypothetical protein
MQRRTFLSASIAAAGLHAASEAHAHQGGPSGRPGYTAEGRRVLVGSPVVSGPAPESITILQSLGVAATGYLEYSVDDGSPQRVNAASGGLLPYEQHVLKFRLPPLPAGKQVRYHVTAREVNWIPVKQFVHGTIVNGEAEVGEECSFRTLDPAAAETRFVVWNDTHENAATLAALAKMTAAAAPDFLLWNGDQTNDVHYESEMGMQVLTPGGQELAAKWPLAYVRGNHDLRGPAARNIPAFTGTPDDRFYYGFRSGPLSALVMDTGEDKPDDHPALGGLAAFAEFRRRQTEWLGGIVTEPWFRDAPFRVLFCHLPLWWIRERRDIDYWEYSKPCREAWAPILAEAGAQLVISGHTHNHAWMPAGANQPLGQLVGGGPQPQHATFIEGHVTRDRLAIVVRDLAGKELHNVEIDGNES